ncbi:MAG: hypothetical protein ABSA22_12085, partial [Acidimicrobiales bacterium]
SGSEFIAGEVFDPRRVSVHRFELLTMTVRRSCLIRGRIFLKVGPRRIGKSREAILENRDLIDLYRTAVPNSVWELKERGFLRPDAPSAT